MMHFTLSGNGSELLFSAAELEAQLEAIFRVSGAAPWPVGLWTALNAFRVRWSAVEAQFGADSAGELARRDACLLLIESLDPLEQGMLQSACNTNDLLRSFLSQVQALVPRSRFSLQRLAPGGTPRVSRPIASVSPAQATFHRPVFIVSAPRSGSTMLFDLLSTLSGVWTIGGESHALESDLPALHPAAHDFDSNRLLASDLTPALRGQVIPWFLARLRDRRRVRWSTLTDHCKPKTLRLLEKTPKNSLRIPFLHALFPDARFIYLCRAPQPCLASMMEGWRSRQFVAYRNLPGWPYREWSFLLVPNWRTLAQTSLATLVAEQWRAANSAILDDLEGLPRQNWCRIHYEDLIQEPAIALAMLSRFCELEWTDETSALLSASLPVSRQSLSLPSLDKWRKHEHEIAPVMHRLEPLLSRISALESQ